MNISETLQLIAALKAAGATHFKSVDMDVTFGASPIATVTAPVKVDEVPVVTAPVAGTPVETVENKEATEKLKGLINTLSMSPEDLANQIFPAGAY